MSTWHKRGILHLSWTPNGTVDRIAAKDINFKSRGPRHLVCRFVLRRCELMFLQPRNQVLKIYLSEFWYCLFASPVRLISKNRSFENYAENREFFPEPLQVEALNQIFLRRVGIVFFNEPAYRLRITDLLNNSHRHRVFHEVSGVFHRGLAVIRSPDCTLTEPHQAPESASS